MRMYLTGYDRLDADRVLLKYEASPGARIGERFTMLEDVGEMHLHPYGETIEITIKPITEG